MKKTLLVLFLTLILLSCSREQRSTDSYPNLLVTDADWIMYEGTLPAQDGFDAWVELSLMPGAPGLDARYSVRETLMEPGQKDAAIGGGGPGTYSVLVGSSGQNIVKLIDCPLVSKHMFQRGNKRQDVYLATDGEYKLILIDADLRKVDPRYRLIRRSDLFTTEGYLTVYPDTAEYFERNTRKKWPLARFACYNDAINMYHSLGMRKHEGMYLKALSYSTRQVDKNGNEYDALVFKDILLMDSAFVK